MIVSVLKAGCVDIEGEDALEDIYYDYDAAVRAARRHADKIIRDADEDGPIGMYQRHSWFGDLDDDQNSVARISLHRGDPEAPDYWWTVEPKILAT